MDQKTDILIDLQIQLRLDGISQDAVGWVATFYGKPDIHGNRITVPISEEHARQLEVGTQYIFTLDE